MRVSPACGDSWGAEIKCWDTDNLFYLLQGSFSFVGTPTPPTHTLIGPEVHGEDRANVWGWPGMLY